MQISIMPEAAGLAPRGLLALIVRDSDGLGAQAECRLKAGALGLPGKPTFDAAGAPVGMSELAATDANRNDDRPYDYQNLQLGLVGRRLRCGRWSHAQARPQCGMCKGYSQLHLIEQVLPKRRYWKH